MTKPCPELFDALDPVFARREVSLERVTSTNVKDATGTRNHYKVTVYSAADPFLRHELKKLAVCAAMDLDKTSTSTPSVELDVLHEPEYDPDIRLLCDMGREVLTQDNAITADPIFYVQERHVVHGLTLDYADGHEETEGGEVVHTKDVWVNVQPFFTRKGAEAYISANAHNLNDPRVYVGSAYRNYEWQAVRRYLAGLVK